MACVGLAGCPADPEPGDTFPEGESQSPATEDPERPVEGEVPEREGEAFPVEDYFPLELGLQWDWDFRPRFDPANPARVLQTVTEHRIGDGFQVWELMVEGPPLVLVGFRDAIDANGVGYIVRVEDRFFRATDPGDLDNLPDTEGLKEIAIPSDLRPGIVSMEIDGETILRKYSAGTLRELLPEGANHDFFGDAFLDFQDCVGIAEPAPTPSGWSAAKTILGRGVGLLFSTDGLFGGTYLQAFGVVKEVVRSEGHGPADVP